MMKIDKRVKEAEFNISKDFIVRYIKGAGFWVLKQENELWNSYLKGFKCNSLAVGFKEQYGFGYKDLKPFFFTTFEEALNADAGVEYWEYNRLTHEKVFDSILRKGRMQDMLYNFVSNKEEILNKIDEVYGRK